MGLQIWIPSSAQERKRFLACGVPGCGARFPLTQHDSWVRHTRDCSERNEDRIESVLKDAREDPILGVIDEERYLRERQLRAEKGHR